jgi:hypothetical protein
VQLALRGIHPDDRVAALSSRSENAVAEALPAAHPHFLQPPARDVLRRSAMMTFLLLLALMLLPIYAGWLWTAPGVREAGLVELLVSLAAGVLVGCLLAEGRGWLN